MTEQSAVISARPRLKVDGELHAGLGDAVQAALIRQPLAGMANAEVRLLNWGGDANGKPDFRFQDVKLGSRIEIHLGETRDNAVFDGFITAIEERYGEGAPQIVLLAEDGLHRLARRRASRVFQDMSLDDVARQIAQGAGLQADANISGATATWHQLNESDLAFLLRLLAPHDVHPRLEGGTLRARDEEADREPVQLDPGRNAERVRLIADLNHQPASVAVHGYNLNADAAADGSAETLSPAPEGETGAGLLGSLGWEGESVLPHPFPQTQAEAEALAQRGFRRAAQRFLHGEIVCRGDPALKSGREIELTGVSPRLAGRYRVVDCQHRFDNAQGYSTRLKVQRPDWSV
ncbi:MAG: phage late control D family protein [Betaproteobacteria bacterium]|nr:phage late control D family protein [Betaproteobacteria bacterium]